MRKEGRKKEEDWREGGREEMKERKQVGHPDFSSFILENHFILFL